MYQEKFIENEFKKKNYTHNLTEKIPKQKEKNKLTSAFFATSPTARDMSKQFLAQCCLNVQFGTVAPTLGPRVEPKGEIHIPQWKS